MRKREKRRSDELRLADKALEQAWSNTPRRLQNASPRCVQYLKDRENNSNEPSHRAPARHAFKPTVVGRLAADGETTSEPK